MSLEFDPVFSIMAAKGLVLYRLYKRRGLVACRGFITRESYVLGGLLLFTAISDSWLVLLFTRRRPGSILVSPKEQVMASIRTLWILTCEGDACKKEDQV